MRFVNRLFALMLSASLVFTNTCCSFADEAEPPVEENVVEEQTVEEDNTVPEVPEENPEAENNEDEPDSNVIQDDVNNLNQSPITGSVSQNGITVNVNAPVNSFIEGTDVVITPLSNEQSVQYIQSVAPDANAFGFDISFVNGSEKVQPQNGQTVSLQFIVDGDSDITKYDSSIIDLYHVNSTGEIELLNSSNIYKRGNATVINTEASSFSPFILVENETVTAEESIEEEPAKVVHGDVITDYALYTQDGQTPIGDSIIGRWSIERVIVQFALPNGRIHEGDTTTLTLPNELVFNQTAGFEIIDQDGHVVANAVIDGSTKQLTLTYTDYPETHSDISGTFFFYVETDKKVVLERETVTLEMDVNGNVLPRGPYTFEGIGDPGSYTGQKWGWQKSSTDRHRLVWRIRLNTNGKGIKDLTINDHVQVEHNTYDQSTLKIYKGTWIVVNGDWTLTGRTDVTSQYTVNWAPDNMSYTLYLGDINEGDAFEIRYETVADYELQDSEVIKNSATLTVTNVKEIVLSKSIRYAQAGGTAEGYQFGIDIKKADEYTGEALEGAVFEVIREINGSVVGTITTDASGNGSIRNLLKETYILKETVPPEGYLLSDKEYKITPDMFDDDKVAAIEIDNIYNAKGSAKLNAKKAGNPELGENTFRFELLDEEGNIIETSEPVKQGETAKFKDLNYTLEDLEGAESKTFTYTIREKLPEGVTEENPVKDGIIYDTHEQTAEVTVIDNKDKTLVVKYDGSDTFTTPVFENTVSVGKLRINKEAEGTADTEKEFRFEITLTASESFTLDDTYPASLNGEDTTAQIVDGKVSVTLKANQYYEITGLPEGTEYTVKEITIPDGYKLKESTNTEGTINAEGAVSTFINEYHAEGEGEIKVQKVLKGREWKDTDSFTFTISAEVGTPLPPVTNITITKEDADQTKSFGKIPFTAEGTYTYTVKEERGSIDGVTYDPTEHIVTITAVDDGNGNLVAEEGDTLIKNEVITNTYSSTEAAIEATKEFNDWGKADSFTFNLAAVTPDAPMPASTSAIATEAAPTASFGTVKFEKSGTYEYIITEVDDGVDGVTYDTSEHKAVVTVTKAEDTNKLSASVRYDGKSALVINNKYETSPNASIQVTKAFIEWDKAETFTFNLTAVTEGAPMPENDSVTVTQFYPVGVFGDVSYSKAGIYEYTITEVNNHVDGVTYDTTPHKVVVTVTKEEGNKLIPEVTYDGKESLIVTNTYSPTKATIEATKEFNDWSKANSFTFKLGAVDDAPMPSSDTAVATEDAPLAIFGEIEYEKSGEYKYTITEVNDHIEGVTYDDTEHEVIVTVTADPDTNELSAEVKYDGADSLIVTNTFKAVKAHAEATKEMENGYWGKDGEFTFTFDLAAATEGAPMPEETSLTVTKDEPTAVFGDMEFDKAGTYQYLITEQDGGLKGVTYDTAAHAVTVEVTADPDTNELSAEVTYEGADALTITNSYAAKGEYEFGGIKTLEGKDLEDAEFSFTLTGDKGADQTVMNLGESFTFESIEFTLEDLEQNEDGTYKDGEFKYTIKEAAGDEKGVTYDETEYEITLTVSDNGDGTLEVTADKEIEEIEFINVYTQEKGEGEFIAKKILTGNQKLKAQQFTFELKDKDGKVLQSRKNDANGNVQFDKIEYEEKGEYVYTVSEVNDGQKDIIYDNSVYTITVKVEDGEDGKYKVTSVITKGGQVVEGIVFRNTTTPNTGIYNGAVFFTGAAGASITGIAILEYLRRRQKNSKK